MSLDKIGVCTDPNKFMALQLRHRGGVGWTRGNLGSECEVKRGTIFFCNPPQESQIVSLLEHDPLSNPEQARRYCIGIASLVSPWANMFDEPPFPRFNRQVSRFAGSYDSPGYFPLSKFESTIKLLLDKLLPQIEAREKKYRASLEADNQNMGSHDDGEFFAILGSRMSERSPKEVEAARRRIVANQERRILRKAEPVSDELAVKTVFENADVAYLLAILSSNEIGIKHDVKSVRMGALNIIDGITRTIIPSMIKEITDPLPIIGLTPEQRNLELIADAILLLLGIRKIITAKNCGTNDRNSSINSKAAETERYIYEACIKLEELKKNLGSTPSSPPL